MIDSNMQTLWVVTSIPFCTSGGRAALYSFVEQISHGNLQCCFFQTLFRDVRSVRILKSVKDIVLRR